MAIRMPFGGGRSRFVRTADGSFPIEISKYEYCDDKEERVLDGCTIYAYTPTMLVLRESCGRFVSRRQSTQNWSRGPGRPRGRDFLDIHVATEYFRLDFRQAAFQDTLRKIFLVKRVPLRLLSVIGTSDVREFHRPDFVSVVDTLKPDFDVQTYDYYFDYVAGEVPDVRTPFGTNSLHVLLYSADLTPCVKWKSNSIGKPRNSSRSNLCSLPAPSRIQWPDGTGRYSRFFSGTRRSS